jgi:hypothetical protein
MYSQHNNKNIKILIKEKEKLLSPRNSHRWG